MIQQPLAGFSVMPCATEEDMGTATFLGATQDSGYCGAVSSEGTGTQQHHTPPWSHQPRLLFSAARSCFRLCWSRSLGTLSFAKLTPEGH